MVEIPQASEVTAEASTLAASPMGLPRHQGCTAQSRHLRILQSNGVVISGTLAKVSDVGCVGGIHEFIAWKVLIMPNGPTVEGKGA